MKKLTDKGIILTDFPNFSVADTLECGQIFRYRKIDETTYEVFSLDKYARLTTCGNKVTVTTDDPAYFDGFFDFSADYASAASRLAASSPVLQKAVECGSGIRLLRQDLYETIVSFIVSANNNIKRIQKILERICRELGQKTAYGYAFPTVEELFSATERDFAEFGAGYRARYLADTAQKLRDFDLKELKNQPTSEARRSLMNFMGVGRKVADCILLFGMGRRDVFPVDTWIKKVYHAYYEQGHKDEQISDFFIGLYGEDAGLCQQYLFNYQRKL